MNEQNKKLQEFLKNVDLREQQEFRQAATAIMLTIRKPDFNPGNDLPFTCFDVNEIYGSFTFTSASYELLERFERKLKKYDEDSPEYDDVQGDMEQCIFVLLSGIFAEMFYVFYDSEIPLSNEFTIGDIFNYYFFSNENEVIRNKVNGLLRLMKRNPIEDDVIYSDSECPYFVDMNLYSGEMKTIWARKTQLDLVAALRELGIVPGQIVWFVSSENMRIQKEYEQGDTTRLYAKFDYSGFKMQVNT